MSVFSRASDNDVILVTAHLKTEMLESPNVISLDTPEAVGKEPLPNIMLLEPVVKVKAPALVPIAVLLIPEVILSPAKLPNATLPCPVHCPNALVPKAQSSCPVAFFQASCSPTVL